MTDASAPDPAQPIPRWKLLGPGIVAAATGVGAGDLVATLIAGSRYGYALLWAAVIGTVLKIALAEAVGRWTLSTGQSMFEGWSSLGRWTQVYFGLYVVVWGFVYGAAGMTAAGLPLAALFADTPVALDLKTWSMICGVIGLGLVWIGNYALFEKVMAAFVGVMFVTVVGLAVLVSPDLPSLAAGLVPSLPQGSAFYTLGLIGGVGGTITMAAYGYWITAKGWRGPSWIKVMRLDNRVAYLVTGLFVIAMLVVGAELLFAAGIALQNGDRGLLDLGAVLEERFGRPIAIAFLIGFFATSFSSILGVWEGVSRMFADFIDHVRKRETPTDGERGWPARAYLLWLTFPPMILLFIERPFGLIVAYGALGALFMPFLAGTLLWLLNSDRIPAEWRSHWLSNGLLAASAVLFTVLAARELLSLLG